MNVLRQAIAHYKKGDYAGALRFFEEAAKTYGQRLVEANILKCRKALASNKTDRLDVDVIRRHDSNQTLDPATKLMLANGGIIQLSEEERDSLREEYRKATSRRSQDVAIKEVNPIPSDWPRDLKLAPLPKSTNDFIWNRSRKARLQQLVASTSQPVGLSIVIPTFNRSRILDITLACLVNQITRYAFEVIVADDGSQESIEQIVRKYEPLLDIKYVRQKDHGYQLCAVRNLGLRTARYPFVSILDCDMAPNPRWVQSYAELLMEDDDVALIGPRKYVDTSAFSADAFLANPSLIGELPEVVTNNPVAGILENTRSVDWRLEHFRVTHNLQFCDTPFRFFSGGNVAFSRKWLDRVGWFDEEFNHWGGEDNEFGYRLYRAGCFFRAVEGGLAYHQEPPGKENETDREEGKRVTIQLVKEKVPYYYRRIEKVDAAKIRQKPLVSIYIPAYNCAQSIVRCVDSALNQTVSDLEVCVCDDGSTDDTLSVINRHYSSHPRVRIVAKPNGGIGSASNAALRIARGYYIGQLDSDDYLEPDAVELCLKEFFADRSLVCVYTTNRNVRADGSLIAPGYNWPVYSREKLTVAMIVHHFRMFTARAWAIAGGFNETLVNAVDYDFYLRLSEIGPFRHINKIAYNRVVHGGNTSIVKLSEQKRNHFRAINSSLSRQGITRFRCDPADEDDSSRNYRLVDVLAKE